MDIGILEHLREEVDGNPFKTLAASFLLSSWPEGLSVIYIHTYL